MAFRDGRRTWGFGLSRNRHHDLPPGVSLPVITEPATITGTPKSGNTATAHIAGSTGGAGTLSYQWFRNGVHITGQAASTYAWADADVGTSTTVKVILTNSSGADTATSAAVGPVASRDFTPAAVTFPAASHMRRNGEIVGKNTPKGFVVAQAKWEARNADVVSLGNGKLKIKRTTTGFSFEAHDAAATAELTAHVVATVADGSTVVAAWDTGFANGSRKLAFYVDNVAQTVVIDTDTGAAFDIAVGGNGPHDALVDDVGDVTWQALGVWLDQSIVETNSTITAANRIKLVNSNGSLANPDTWHAGPKIKFIGEAVEFIDNTGTSGEFEVTGDSPIDSITADNTTLRADSDLVFADAA